ncbi:hypothetical protein B9G69_011705 [Bdellovibrio sp. SKB1291214]|uniref:hypothetical protein n=1 Tax=Bdellovibrio sp. SKB1291214 TaxID=1732569 RepID=UPI000B51E5CC|nr:hypothetical protein [Bdellovibrio sp. SKB1291214]UYL07711.1 hypothetical protein B9G69_011705 [Bdellovibrio sp. SKB1291214]
MQRVFVQSVLTVFCLVFVLGCSDAKPTVSFLRPMDNFEFKPSKDVVTSTLTTIPLHAECSRFITSVDLSFDGGTTWTSSDAYDPGYVICSKDGTYEITLSNSKAPLNSMTINNGDSFIVKFRAWSRAGIYVYREVTVRYVPPAQIKQGILAGAGVQTGTGLVLRGRILAHQQQTASGGGFKVSGRVAE